MVIGLLHLQFRCPYCSVCSFDVFFCTKIAIKTILIIHYEKLRVSECYIISSNKLNMSIGTYKAILISWQPSFNKTNKIYARCFNRCIGIPGVQ